MREVVILGVGMHKFGRFPEKPYFEMGKIAIQNTLKETDIRFEAVEAAFCGNVYGDTGAGHRIIAQIRLKEIPIVNVENACSNGGSGLRLAYQQIAAGIYDIVLAFGFEKQERGFIPNTAFTMWERHLRITIQPTQYAIKAQRHIKEFRTTIKHFAKVSVKNHKNGCYNPNAHYQQMVTVKEVLNSQMICNPLTLYMCCPTSDGAAAAVLCSKEKAARYTTNPVTIAGVALASGVYGRHFDEGFDRMVKISAEQAYEAAGISPEDLDMVETHKAFASAEISQAELLGICRKGEYTKLIDAGETEITGRIPVNPSGGLIARGHPLGATSLAQVSEIYWQLKGMAGQRQISNPKVGLTHTTKAKPNSCVIILKK